MKPTRGACFKNIKFSTQFVDNQQGVEYSIASKLTTLVSTVNYSAHTLAFVLLWVWGLQCGLFYTDRWLSINLLFNSL